MKIQSVHTVIKVPISNGEIEETETKHMFLTHTCYMHFNTNLMDGLISLMSPSMKSICNLRNVILCTMVTVFVRLLHPCFVFFTITAHLGITFYTPLTSEC